MTENYIEDGFLLNIDIDPETILGKKYLDGEWVEPPAIRYINEIKNNRIMSIKETVYVSEVSGEIIDNEIQELYIRYENSWHPEEYVKKITKPQGHPSWIWSFEKLIWEPPIPMPTEGGPWIWNEEIGNWEELPLSVEQ